MPTFSTLKCHLLQVNSDANIPDAWSITKKNKILILHAIIIAETLFSMILKKDGHVVIKLYMIGMSSKSYPLVLLADTLTKNKTLNFTSRTLWVMLKMLWKNKNLNLLSLRTSINTTKVHLKIIHRFVREEEKVGSLKE